MPNQQEISHVSLPNNVADAIRDNLPEQVSKLLRERLALADKALQENEDLKGDLIKAEKILDEHGDIRSARRRMAAETKDLETFRAELQRKEDTLELQRSQLELESANRYATKLEGALAGLVRNTEWRERVHDMEVVSSTGDSNGGYSEQKVPADTTRAAE